MYFLIVALGQLAVWAGDRHTHREQLADAHLRALQAQLQPHFLYNTLNTISALVMTKRNAEAMDVLHGLGGLLRQLLAPGASHEVPAGEEMRFIEEYLAIERIRFSDRLQISCTVEPDAAAALVPRFILQPVVDNAIRHGIAPRVDGGQVSVTIARTGDALRMRVSDDGAGIVGPTHGLGTGLDITRRRLACLYGDGGTLTMSPRAGAAPTSSSRRHGLPPQTPPSVARHRGRGAGPGPRRAGPGIGGSPETRGQGRRPDAGLRSADHRLDRGRR